VGCSPSPSTGSQVPPENLLQRGLLSPWAQRSCQEPAPARAPHEITVSFRHIHLLQHGVVHGLQVDICSTVDLHGCRGTACLTMVFSAGCRGISGLAPGAPPPPSFFSDLGVCRVPSLTCSHSSLSIAVPQQVFPLLNYVTPDALPPSLMGLSMASSGSILELPGIGSIGHRGSFSQLLTQATPVAPSCYQNLAMQTQYKFICQTGDY